MRDLLKAVLEYGPLAAFGIIGLVGIWEIIKCVRWIAKRDAEQAAEAEARKKPPPDIRQG